MEAPPHEDLLIMREPEQGRPLIATQGYGQSLLIVTAKAIASTRA